MITLQEALERAARLPSVSAVLSQALQEMGNPQAEICQVAALLARDQSAMARILRVANSAFYGLPGRVGSLSQAVTLLGIPTTRTVVTTAALIDRFPQREDAGFNFRKFWEHSLGVAAAAHYLAPRAGVNADSAFVAGMLHDIGIAVLGCCMLEEFTVVLEHAREHDCALEESEQAILHFTHDELGAALAEQWKFPTATQEAIRSHHILNANASPLARVTHLANIFAHVLDLGGVERDFVPAIDAQAWRALQLTEPELPSMLAAIDAQAQSVMSILQGS